MNVQLVKLAEDYCKLHHGGQFRKNGRPYFEHPFEVRNILNKYEYSDFVTQCIALLHDIFEDTEIIMKEIKENFGYEVANGVYILSRNTIDTYERDVILNIMGVGLTDLPKDMTPRKIVEKLYKARLAFARNKIMRVKIADMIDNTRDLYNLHSSGIERKINDSKNFYIPLGKEIAPEMIKELEENVRKFEEGNN